MYEYNPRLIEIRDALKDINTTLQTLVPSEQCAGGRIPGGELRDAVPAPPAGDAYYFNAEHAPDVDKIAERVETARKIRVRVGKDYTSAPVGVPLEPKGKSGKSGEERDYKQEMADSIRGLVTPDAEKEAWTGSPDQWSNLTDRLTMKDPNVADADLPYTPLVSDFERGARAAVEDFALYFCDEDGNAVHENLPNEVLDMFANGAIFSVLAQEQQRVGSEHSGLRISVHQLQLVVEKAKEEVRQEFLQGEWARQVVLESKAAVLRDVADRWSDEVTHPGVGPVAFLLKEADKYAPKHTSGLGN